MKTGSLKPASWLLHPGDLRSGRRTALYYYYYGGLARRLSARDELNIMRTRGSEVQNLLSPTIFNELSQAPRLCVTIAGKIEAEKSSKFSILRVLRDFSLDNFSGIRIHLKSSIQGLTRHGRHT